ncbi:HesA/MoeB/ThiF family protein, partial [Staphylococcus aureus]
QRQTLFGDADVGAGKVAAAALAAHRINPHVVIDQRPERLTPDNAARLLGGADVVIDGTDSFTTRLAVADAAHALRTPLVSSAVGQFEGQ